jgi:ADP-heptose:LPS heptosyltransferase
LLAGAAAVVGVDTGLTHLASAVGAPVVAIYAASWSEFNGVMGPGFVANLGGPGAPPDTDEVWTQTLAAIKSGRKDGAWRAAAAEPAPELAGRRRFRPSNARAVVHRR